MNDQQRLKLAHEIAGMLMRDLRNRNTTTMEIPEQTYLMIQAHWANLVFSKLPDGLTGTSPRDRLAPTYVDSNTAASPASEVIDDL